MAGQETRKFISKTAVFKLIESYSFSLPSDIFQLIIEQYQSHKIQSTDIWFFLKPHPGMEKKQEAENAVQQMRYVLITFPLEQQEMQELQNKVAQRIKEMQQEDTQTPK